MATAGHNVVLTWNPSIDAGPGVGYNIFRGTAAGKENSTPIATGIAVGATTAAACTYTDNNVVAGGVYFYYIETETGSTVSSPSTEVSVTVPLAPPTNLQAVAV